MGAAMAFAPSRGWLGGSANTARAGRHHHASEIAFKVSIW